MEGTVEEWINGIQNWTGELDEEVKMARKKVGGTSGPTFGSCFDFMGEHITYDGRIYVLPDGQLQYALIQLVHDSPTGRHPGWTKSLDQLSCHYWWPRMPRYLADYVWTCKACNQVKSFPRRPAGFLNPNEISERHWGIITHDLVTFPEEMNSYNTIWVVVDRLTKRAWVTPTMDKVTAAGMAWLFRDNVWRNHGLPDAVISDRDPRFLVDFSKELNKLLGIEKRASTAFHPQMDGQTEWVNQDLETHLCAFVNMRQTDWPEWLLMFEFMYNN